MLHRGASIDVATGETDAAMDDVLRPVPHARRIVTIALVVAGAIASQLHASGRVGLPLDVIGITVALAGGWSIWRETWLALRQTRRRA